MRRCLVLVILAACGGGSSSHPDAGAPDASAVDAAPPDAAPCAPSASCPAVEKTCLGLVENAGQAQAPLRLAELVPNAPGAFTVGLLRTAMEGAVRQNLSACNENGSATFNWLLRFDTAAGTLTTGGAKPVTDPLAGYAFDDEMITSGAMSFHVQPVTVPGAINPDGTFDVHVGDLLVPVFLDASGSTVILLPLKSTEMTGKLSPDHDCVGAYNANGLDPGSSCAPDSTTPLFLTGGKATGYMTLEDADKVEIAALGETLCVLLSEDPAKYGDTNSPKHCLRDMSTGQILFQGDWCAATNSAATSTCFDASRFDSDFAASSVKITN